MTFVKAYAWQVTDRALRLEDRVIAKSLGLIAGGAFLLLIAAHRMTSPKIGA